MRGKLAVFCFTLFATLGSFSSSFADHFTSDDLAKLKQRIVEYEAALTAKEFKIVVEVMPPKFIAAMALKAKVDEIKLRATVAKILEETMNKTEIVSYSMEENKLVFENFVDGNDYILIPTEIVIRMDNKKIRSVSHTLAILEEGRWYLVRTGEAPQRMMLTDTYPAFKNVDFPDQQMMEIE